MIQSRCLHAVTGSVDTVRDECGAAWHACKHLVHCMLDTALSLHYPLFSLPEIKKITLSALNDIVVWHLLFINNKQIN